MSLMSSLHKKWVEFKYQYYGLNIIQEVSITRFHSIIDLYIERGWELSGEYYPIDANQAQWSCKLRKGTSTLLCHWSETCEGDFIGPERIIYGLGKEFGFTPSPSPQSLL